MKTLFSALVVAGSVALIGCQTNTVEEEPINPRAQQEQYSGILPCADCSGIRTSLTLYRDQHNNPTRFQLREDYMDGADVKLSHVDRGEWISQEQPLNNTRYHVFTLNPDQPEEQRKYIKDAVNAIEMLDQDGNRIDSQLNYRLLLR